MDPHRRWVLFAAAATAALSGCGAISTTTTGGVTTLTINVAQLNAWGQAFSNGAKLISGLPGILGTPAGLAIFAITTAAASDLAAFNVAAGGSVSLKFDRTSIPAAVQSLANDGQTLLTDSVGALGNVATTAMTTAQTYVSAVQALVSLFQAALGVAPVAAMRGATPMSEAHALATLNVH
jgi:hypothetical protein